MRIEFLLEERSAEAVMRNIVPKIINWDAIVGYHVFNGKHDLLGKLPNRLKGYKEICRFDPCKIVVLIDKDRQDCHVLKTRLERVAADAGLITKTQCGLNMQFQVLNRLAIEELEAWFFGDNQALSTAYPRVPTHLHAKAKYRNPDGIPGGTSQALERVLMQAGYYAGGMPKIEVAMKVSSLMNPDRNTSKSFQVFKAGLLALRIP
ncbi:MAG: DUF4276 family protein [candidate division Zixibacteria bacterium]|nr:DUF4276 family protein [candidate division Zixibacteria bacterium]